MSGVLSQSEFFCAKCDKKTMHDTGWQSEDDPDALWIKCQTCGRDEVKRPI